MSFHYKTFHSEADLTEHLKTHRPSFYYSSKTSTVIPYDKLTEMLPMPEGVTDFYICDLTKIPGSMELKENGNLVLRGAISWQEAQQFLTGKGRNLKTSPTEHLALITAGVATSCTGERCFAFGNLRRQIVQLKYLDYNGEEKILNRELAFKTDSSFHAPYQAEFEAYSNFKNAPYPRFEKAIDLMIGTEGQLGLVTEVEIETAENFAVNHVFMLLPKWEEDFEPHREVYNAVQSHRDDIISVELLDSNCMNYLKPDEKLGENQDVIFLEIRASAFEKIYEEVLLNFQTITSDQVFEIGQNKFHHIRAGVPRAIFEVNSQMGVVKMGTDVQVSSKYLDDLINFYREAAKVGVRYCLFGHFGDGHLHYNYMPRPDQTAPCQEQFLKLYDNVLKWNGSPFAEHGIGLLKQKFIKKFHSGNQQGFFKDLKKEHDPHNQFFPQGFMLMK